MAGRSRNLLKNPCAKGGLIYWETVRSGGDGFSCEKVPIGSKKLSDCGHKRDNPIWATSYQSCEKRQLVPLLAPGISGKRLDAKKPPIIVRDWYTSRSDCGCKYNISVRLLAGDRETELDTWDQTDTLEAGSDWKKVKHVFKDYPPGVRYVDFRHGGKDTKYWAGHYGVKMTKSGVFVGNNPKKWEGAERNLLQNPSAQSGLDGWEVIANGGHGLIAEKEAVGCKPVMEAMEDAEPPSCWATSYSYCEKRQSINLEKHGFCGGIMDEVKPEIKIIDWYTSRNDCGCEYIISVRLLAGDRETELDKWVQMDTLEAGSDWMKTKHVFKNYRPGVRFVEFRHGGKDTKYWAGHYGVKITKSAVYVGKKIQKKVKAENLLTNPFALSGLYGWEVTASGGDGLVAEKTAAGCTPVMEAVENAEAPSCWATSYSDCAKKQVINLQGEGIVGSVMDEAKPDIKVTDWFSPRDDAGCLYWLTVRLLDGGSEELARREAKEKKTAGESWAKVELSFTDYPEGVRMIEFSHGGKDTCYWAGNYGTKMTHSSVVVELKRSPFDSSSSSYSSSDEG